MKQHQILCLHGRHSNNDITEIQIHALQLPKRVQCVSLHGKTSKSTSFIFLFPRHDVAHTPIMFKAPHTTPTCFSALHAYSEGPWYAWDSVTETAVSKPLEESLKYLAKFLKENGPFDGVYGFSQGVAMITNFSHPSIWRDRFQFERCPWNFAILACGGASTCMSLDKDDSRTIEIPSFQIFGARDPIKPDSHVLERYWDASRKITYTHRKGHEIDLQILRVEKSLKSLLDNFLDKQL
jgi:pimeloyl-ACP methyl ester carboxylesterase